MSRPFFQFRSRSSAKPKKSNQSRLDWLQSPAERKGCYAFSHSPGDHLWQAHGAGRAFHQAAHSARPSRVPKSGRG